MVLGDRLVNLPFCLPDLTAINTIIISPMKEQVWYNNYLT